MTTHPVDTDIDRADSTAPPEPSGCRARQESGTRALGHAEVRDQVNALLAGFLDEQTGRLPYPGMASALEFLRTFVLEGGKRMRPVFCYWGWRAAGGTGTVDSVVYAAASLELSHAFWLLQDDIIDHSATRRGRPALHHQLADHHEHQGWHGPARDFGVSTAILLSDLCLSWSGMLLDQVATASSRVRALKAIQDRMQTDTAYGQSLELFLQSERNYDKRHCLEVVHYKAGRYGVTPALCMGAVLADAGADLLDQLTEFGVAVGEGYQLRDDLLGTFGDPGATGKPNIDDLTEGKPTVLVAEALHRATPDQAARILHLYGHPQLSLADVGELRALLRSTGAVTAVEAAINAHAEAAVQALAAASVPTGTARVLKDLVRVALQRDR